MEKEKEKIVVVHLGSPEKDDVETIETSLDVMLRSDNFKDMLDTDAERQDIYIGTKLPFTIVSSIFEFIQAAHSEGFTNDLIWRAHAVKTPSNWKFEDDDDNDSDKIYDSNDDGKEDSDDDLSSLSTLSSLSSLESLSSLSDFSDHEDEDEHDNKDDHDKDQNNKKKDDQNQKDQKDQKDQKSEKGEKWEKKEKKEKKAEKEEKEEKEEKIKVPVKRATGNIVKDHYRVPHEIFIPLCSDPYAPTAEDCTRLRFGVFPVAHFFGFSMVLDAVANILALIPKTKTPEEIQEFFGRPAVWTDEMQNEMAKKFPILA